ncbi:hypothetical protein PR048_011453 [Dryococelus australis]|uniref:Uncharacterized protein n=1 Tax=Dryococelus australis TaxID=614101 RepID=A0ABQ9HLL5_9NEOP|nr:hypothetical protein PR048_011453 [Dryococelus australis]
MTCKLKAGSQQVMEAPCLSKLSQAKPYTTNFVGINCQGNMIACYSHIVQVNICQVHKRAGADTVTSVHVAKNLTSKQFVRDRARACVNRHTALKCTSIPFTLSMHRKACSHAPRMQAAAVRPRYLLSTHSTITQPPPPPLLWSASRAADTATSKHASGHSVNTPRVRVIPGCFSNKRAMRKPPFHTVELRTAARSDITNALQRRSETSYARVRYDAALWDNAEENIIPDIQHNGNVMQALRPFAKVDGSDVACRAECGAKCRVNCEAGYRVAELKGHDKGDTATCIKCGIAAKRKVVNWHTVFSSQHITKNTNHSSFVYLALMNWKSLPTDNPVWINLTDILWCRLLFDMRSSVETHFQQTTTSFSSYSLKTIMVAAINRRGVVSVAGHDNTASASVVGGDLVTRGSGIGFGFGGAAILLHHPTAILDVIDLLPLTRVLIPVTWSPVSDPGSLVPVSISGKNGNKPLGAFEGLVRTLNSGLRPYIRDLRWPLKQKLDEKMRGRGNGADPPPCYDVTQPASWIQVTHDLNSVTLDDRRLPSSHHLSKVGEICGNVEGIGIIIIETITVFKFIFTSPVSMIVFTNCFGLNIIFTFLLGQELYAHQYLEPTTVYVEVRRLDANISQAYILRKPTLLQSFRGISDRHRLLAPSGRTIVDLGVLFQCIALHELHMVTDIMLNRAKRTLRTGGSLMSSSMAAFTEDLPTESAGRVNLTINILQSSSACGIHTSDTHSPSPSMSRSNSPICDAFRKTFHLYKLSNHFKKHIVNYPSDGGIFQYKVLRWRLNTITSEKRLKAHGATTHRCSFIYLITTDNVDGFLLLLLIDSGSSPSPTEGS